MPSTTGRPAPAPAALPRYLWIVAWRDAARAIAAMPEVALVAFILCILLEALAPDRPGWESSLLNHGIILAETCALAPLVIAVHRYVLLGEVQHLYWAGPWSRLRQFAAYAMLFQIAYAAGEVPIWVARALRPGSLGAFPILVALAIVPMAVFAVTRMLILLPAIAIGAPGASWRKALQDSRGHFWRQVLILSLAFFPATLAVLLFAFVVHPVLPAAVNAAAGAALLVFFGSAEAVIVSRFYQAFNRAR